MNIGLKINHLSFISFVRKTKPFNQMSNKKVQKEEQLVLNRLAVILVEENWNNKQLALALDYDETTISLWSNNHVQPATSTLARIAITLNRNLQDFFVNTTTFDQQKKDKYLERLAEIARNSKRTGKHKTKSAKPRKKT